MIFYTAFIILHKNTIGKLKDLFSELKMKADLP